MKKSVNVSGWGIFAGLIAGILIGILFNYWKGDPFFGPLSQKITDNLFWPLGNAFLQALFMVVVPLVFSSLMVGVANFGKTGSVGRLGKKLFIFYICSTVAAISIGQAFTNFWKPGEGFTPNDVQAEAQTMQSKLSSLKEKSSMVSKDMWPGIVTRVIPRNIIDEFGEGNMLAVIFVSLIFGLGLLYMPNGPPRESFIQFMSALSHLSITIIGWIMKTAPYAVAALLAAVVSMFGLESIKKTIDYILVASGGLLFHGLFTYSLFLIFLVKVPLKRIHKFYKGMFPVFSTAFSTSSSSATMPVTIDTLEKRFGAPGGIVNFSVPIGTVVNMDGTALFEVAATLFIAQIYGVELSLTSQILLAAVVVITSVGIAGAPGASIPILMSAFVIFGIPPEGIAMILGVDRLMDMGRTVVNVTGDSIAALYLSRTEGVDVGKNMKDL